MEGFVDGSGLFGLARHRDAAHLIWLGLHALQHRGTGGVGIAVSDGDLMRYHRDNGLVHEVFGAGALQPLTGALGIGQVYGRGPGAEVPPDALDAAERMLFGRWSGGQVAVALSGRFTNGTRLRRELKERGALFHTSSDAEVLVHLLAQSGQRTFVNRLVDALWKVEGSFSVLICAEDRMIAVRDPRGFRPLVLGRLEEAVIFASEDTAIRFVGGTVQRELLPGEMVIVDRRGVQTVKPFPPRAGAACLQELVGIARSDAQVFGRDAYQVRVELGARLAAEAPCPDARVVIGLPGAGEPLAIGYGRQARIPCERGLLTTPWSGRFHQPAGGVPHLDTRLHFTAVPSVVRGRAVALVVPSLVSGRGARRAVSLLHDAGAAEVHLRVASPPVRSSCFYGVSSPTVDELAAHQPDPLPAWLGATSVGFLSLDALLEVAGPQEGWCRACFDAVYPLPPEEPDDQLPLF